MEMRDAFFDKVYEIAKKDKNVMLLTADMGAISLDKFREDLPKQYINVGVAEQNLICISAGMALAGRKVYAYAIAAFLIYRAFDQIRIDICEMNLPVVLVGAGAGKSYKAEGATHWALHDKEMIKFLPNIKVFTPHNIAEAQACAQYGYNCNRPCYIRLFKGEKL